MKEILKKLINGEITIDDAENKLKANTILEFNDIT